MKYMEYLPLWCLIICLIGLVVGLLTSLLIMISLIKLPFKDISTELRKYSTIFDISLIFILFYSFFASEATEACAVNYLYIVTYNAHAYWIFYMSYVMHKIIYLKKGYDKNSVFLVFAALVLLAAGISGIFFINNHHGICYFDYGTNLLYLIGFLYLMPNMIFLAIIVIFYRNIRRTLRDEVKKCDEINKVNRNLFIRLYGYPIIFFFSSGNFILLFLEWIFYEEMPDLKIGRYIILCYYPLLNSLFYGLTQSSKRFLKYLISNDFEYNIEEDFLYELRIQNYLLPRFYLDLIDQPEENILK